MARGASFRAVWMCFFLDQNICAILFCGEKFVTLDTDTKEFLPSSLLDGQILKERREMNETAEITCRMCDVVLRYAVSDAVPDDRGIRRVACGRCVRQRTFQCLRWGKREERCLCRRRERVFWTTTKHSRDDCKREEEAKSEEQQQQGRDVVDGRSVFGALRGE